MFFELLQIHSTKLMYLQANKRVYLLYLYVFIKISKSELKVFIEGVPIILAFVCLLVAYGNNPAWW